MSTLTAHLLMMQGSASASQSSPTPVTEVAPWFKRLRFVGTTAAVAVVVLLVAATAAALYGAFGSVAAGGSAAAAQSVVRGPVRFGSAVPPCGLEDCGLDCKIPPMPANTALPLIPYLPDPFMSMSGARIATQAEWTCRRAEISAQLQRYELGVKPPSPKSVLGFVGNGTITVSVGDDPFITFTATYTLPTAGVPPYPAMIGIGLSSLNNVALRALGVAQITFNNNDIAEQNNQASRGRGKFYTLYGSNHSAGALMAWAWGVSRLIDVIERHGSAIFDAKRLGVTGCSRNGKGALIVGAFDERIALTIPQESGSGGSASWRLSDWQGTQVQTLGQIVTENVRAHTAHHTHRALIGLISTCPLLTSPLCSLSFLCQVWFSANLNPFANAHNATALPFDHHMVEGLVAPRGLLVIDNSDQVWLGNITSWGCSLIANRIYQALGIGDSQGVSQLGGHNHCAFPAEQQPEVTAFVTRFLLGGRANTSILFTDKRYPTFDVAQWAPWPVPALR